MTRDITVYVEDIFTSLGKIEEYTGGISEEDFSVNSQIQDAVLRRLEVIGEAAKHIPEDFRRKYPEIPWKKMAGLRDVLIHEYFGVNLKRVWRLVQQDVGKLKRQITYARESL